MKKLIIALLITVSFWSKSLAQAYIYHPFPYSNAIWNTAGLDIQGCNYNPCFYTYYELGTDTFVNNLRYVKLLRGGFDNTDSMYAYPVFQGLLIRNDTLNKKVKILVAVKNSIDSEELLYDFNLKVGDTLPNSFINYKTQGLVVLKIDSILLQNGTYRKRFNLNISTAGNYPDNLSLIEGIGYTGGLLSAMINGDFEGETHLACCSYNDTLLYNFTPLGLKNCNVLTDIMQVQKAEITISPNPILPGNNISIKGINESYSLTVYNIMGETIFSKELVDDNQLITLPDIVETGAYLCRIITQDNQVIIKKLVVL